MSKRLVIVESPAKAKKIAEYLGSEYRVEASIGHIRDLPEKNMGVDIAHNFTPEYEISPSKKKRVSELKSAAKGVDEIILATDPDREGEAIAWHLAYVFGIDPASAKRVTYREITKSAIAEAFATPRHIDLNLVNAQQSRRILDRIVGYEVSPVLWKKIRPGLSAGRVQSVAVKLLVEREREIRAFIPKESWKLVAHLDHTTLIEVELTKIAGKKITLKSADELQDFLQKHNIDTENIHEKYTSDKKGNLTIRIDQSESFRLMDTEKKSTKRLPGAPFTTSTLQQEASRKLGYGVKMTMDIAQRLYQNGHITYMRTDSVHLSDLALNSARDYITREFGSEYAMPNGRHYKTRQSNAQEAHEAIRPTYIDKYPGSLHLEPREEKLYRLIWERTVASQMREADIETTTYHFTPFSAETIHDEDWVARGEVIVFPGFMRLYIEGKDEGDDEEGETKKLPILDNNSVLESSTWKGEQKFSLPPARYTEASLVKKLESEGIGRPATYAATIQTIQDRGYVIIESKKLVPTDIAFVVTDYLENEFTQFMQYGFTAAVEEEFDQVARGELEWTTMLGAFYEPFHGSIDRALGMEGRFSGERILGKDPTSDRTLLVRMSRYGPVIQIGSPSELAEGEKPRYANLAPGMSLDDITLEQALSMFSFPKEIGEYENAPLIVGQGRYGPYVKWGEQYVSIPRGTDPHTIDRDAAIALVETKKQEIAPVGHYESEPYTRGKGRFGPYLKYRNLYISIPRSIDPEAITTEEAESLIRAKIEKEAHRYIHQWPDEGISVERGRYGPFIKWNKKNLYLKKNNTKITDEDVIAALTLEDIKAIIVEQVPDAFSTKKSKKSTTSKTEKSVKSSKTPKTTKSKKSPSRANKSK